MGHFMVHAYSKLKLQRLIIISLECVNSGAKRAMQSSPLLVADTAYQGLYTIGGLGY